MIVNNADTSKGEYTVQDFVVEKGGIKGNLESEFNKRGGIVHRLDKETSGILIVSLNEKSFEMLQQQFKKREVAKEYLALCHGEMAFEGQINAPVGRLPWNRKKFGVVPNGREAFTKFELVRRYKLENQKKREVLSLVRVFPKTGRTHQIRVHFQYIGHPIFSDSLYAGRKTLREDRKYLGRHFLHASKISFVSPTTSKKVDFEASLSLELKKFLEDLSPLWGI
jgi:23S rRNA pseudouridine1911/1915/1917 synthase